MTMDSTSSDTVLGNAGRDPLVSGTSRESSGPGSATRDPFVDRAATSAHQAVDRVAAKVSPAAARVRAAAQGSAETVQTKLSDLDVMRQEWTESCRSYVRERPMTAIGVAVLAGFLLSRWMRTS